jgi:hypothetical protein
MRSRVSGVSAVALMVLFVASCDLSHPVSDDGNDIGNPEGHNPGTQTLTVTVGKSILMVGDTTSIVGSVGGAPISANGLLITTSSDSTVARVGGPFILATGVGMATISVSYSGYQASPPVYISVIPRTSQSRPARP